MYEITVDIRGDVRTVPRQYADEESAHRACLRWYNRQWHPWADWRVKDLETGRRWEAVTAIGGSHLMLEIGPELRPCAAPAPACS